MQPLTLEQKKLRYLEYSKEREEAYRERVNSDLYKRFKNEILESIAAEASRAIQKEANAWITQYAMLEKVSVEDAIKKISKTDINEMVKRLNKYSSSDPDSPNYKFTKQMNDWMKQYNVTMRVSRAEYLMRQIDMILADSGLQTVEAINSELTRLTTDEIIRQSGILGLTVPEAKELKIMAETIASESFQTMDFSERIWLNQTNLRNRIGDGLQRSLLLGQHPTKWMHTFESLLTPAFAGSTYAMFRLAITETTRAQIKVHQVMYEKGGYTQFEFIAEPTACEVCADLDGKVFPVETMLQGFDAPPIHPHCRCSTAAYMPEEELDKLFEEGIIEELADRIDINDFEALVKSLGKEDAAAFEEILNNAPEEIKALYRDHANKVNEYKKGTGVYHPDEKTVVYDYSAHEAYPELNKYSTLAHEFGHHIDYTANLGASFKEIGALSRNVRGKSFDPKFFERVNSSSDEFLAGMRADKAALSKIYKDILPEIVPLNTTVGLQDALDGMFSLNKQVQWGHGNRYYNYLNSRLTNKLYESSNFPDIAKETYRELGFPVKTNTQLKAQLRDYSTSGEIWANLMDADTIGGEGLEYMKKYLPNSYEAYKKLIGGK